MNRECEDEREDYSAPHSDVLKKSVRFETRKRETLMEEVRLRNTLCM